MAKTITEIRQKASPAPASWQAFPDHFPLRRLARGGMFQKCHLPAFASKRQMIQSP
jgi:hypothetical protein